MFPDAKYFSALDGEFPTVPHLITDPNSYMLVPHSARNIAHYMEVYTFVYHVLHQPHKFPHVNKVFYPTMENKKIYLWIQHYKEILLSLLPKEQLFDNIFKERMVEVATRGILCFKRVVGVRGGLHRRSCPVV